MIGYGNIADTVIAFCFELIKPFVAHIVFLCGFKQRQPFLTGESEEVHGTTIIISPSYGHEITVRRFLYAGVGLARPRRDSGLFLKIWNAPKYENDRF